MGGFKSGFAAIVGRPNVGKSTFLNAAVGRKLAIVSDKPQTTRNRILAVLHRGDAQVVFLDTPGIHKPRHKLGEYMVEVARSALREVDVALFVVDAAMPPGPGDRMIAAYLAEIPVTVILAVNKMDAVPAADAERVLESFKALGKFERAIGISATRGWNLDELIDAVVGYLPEGPKYFPEDMVTDQPERFVIAELVREKVLHLAREEVPHSVAVDVEEVTERDDGLVYVRGVVYVEKDSQKKIVIGEKGRMLREIGSLARQDIEALLGTRVYLDLWVKVKKGWRNREASLRGFGYTP